MTAFKIILVVAISCAFASGRPSLQPLGVGKENPSEIKITEIPSEKMSSIITTFLHAPNPLMEYMNQQKTTNRRQIIYQQTILLPSKLLSTSVTNNNNKQLSEMDRTSSFPRPIGGGGVRTPATTSVNNNRPVAYQIEGYDQNAWPLQMTIHDPYISMLNSFTNVIEYGSEDEEEKESTNTTVNNNSTTENLSETTGPLEIMKTEEKKDIIKSRSKRSQVTVDKVKVYTLEEVLEKALNSRKGKSIEGRLLPDGEYHMSSELESRPAVTLESFAELVKKDEIIPEIGRRTVPLKKLKEEPSEEIKKKEEKESETELVEERKEKEEVTEKPTKQKKPDDINKKKKEENELFLSLFHPIQYHIQPPLPQGLYPIQFVTPAIQPQLYPTSTAGTYSLINWLRSLPLKKQEKVIPTTEVVIEPENIPKEEVVLRKGGIAIAGPGGEASTGAGGTAIVGPGGVAYAEPNTLSVVGPGGRVLSSQSLAKGSEQVLAWGPIVYHHPAN